MPTRTKPQLSAPIRTFAQPSYSPDELSEVADLLAVLPPSATAVIFVKPQSVLQRAEISYSIDDALSLLSKRTDGILSKVMLSEAGVDQAAFVLTTDSYGAAVLSGDFSGAIGLLREAPATSEGIQKGRDESFDPPSLLEPYREVEVFFFPYYDDLYISLPDEATMLLAQNDQLIWEAIDRYLDGSTLDESLARMLDTTGPADFLVVRWLDAERAGQDSDFPHIYAGGGWLDAEESSSVFTYVEFASPEVAGEWLAERKGGTLVQGYNSGKRHPIQDISRDGMAVFAVGVAPNIDLGGWLLGN